MGHRGVVYFTVGAHYLRHARYSLESLRAYHPEMRATLFCNDNPHLSVFDTVWRYESVNDQYPHNEINLDRVRCLASAPYDVNLHLDADTYVDADLGDMFRLMERFDIAVHQAVPRYTMDFDDVPQAFPAYNTGVILWKWNDGTRALFADWAREMEEWIHAYPDRVISHDAHACQPPFRRVLYHSDLRIATLGDHYLCQVGTGGGITGRAIIFHGCRGRTDRLAKIAAMINAGQQRGKLGTWRYHCQQGSVMLGKSGRGFLPDDDWGKKRKEILGP